MRVVCSSVSVKCCCSPVLYMVPDANARKVYPLFDKSIPSFIITIPRNFCSGEFKMKYRKINGTEIEISVIGMGCWAIAGDKMWGPQKKKDTEASLKTAVDSGINFFDTAELYGDGYSEELLGTFLKPDRENIIIATKAGRSNLAYEDAKRACEKSLRRLKTDYIDLYQIHWPNGDIPMEETVRAFSELRKEGKIREAGISNFGVLDLETLTSSTLFRTNQLPYNLLWRPIEHRIIDKCEQLNMGIICYSPLAQALLTGKYRSADEVPDGRTRSRHFSGSRPMARHGGPGFEDETFAAIDRIRNICARIGRSMAAVSLNWLIHQKGVLTVIAGARNPQQVRANVQAQQITLDSSVYGELASATDTVKEKCGTSPDMWESEENARIH